MKWEVIEQDYAIHIVPFMDEINHSLSCCANFIGHYASHCTSECICDPFIIHSMAVKALNGQTKY